MNKLIICILFLLLTVHVKAEYNGWFIKFKITTKSQKELVGNVYIAQAYFEKDSINNSNYLIERFNTLDNQSEDSLVYYKNLLSYKYNQDGDTNTYTQYGLLNQEMIAINEIKSIEVINMIDFWYLSGIGSSHTIADTIWMKKAPVESFSFGGYLCGWDIFVHEATKKTDRILLQLKELTENHTLKIDSLEKNLKYLNGNDYYQTEEKIESLNDSIDEKASEILKLFDGEKVVILNFCSC